MKQDDRNQILSMKTSKFLLSEKKRCESLKVMQNLKLNSKNATCFYQFSKMFGLTTLQSTTFEYLERCFTIIVDTQNFLEFDYTCISSILGSSKLLISSEIEVYNSADKWFNHDIGKRLKYAKDLILKVRLALLSDGTIKQLIDKSKTCTNNHYFIKFLDGVLEYKNRFIRKNIGTNLLSRYCNQKKLNILVCGGCDNFRRTVMLNV